MRQKESENLKKFIIFYLLKQCFFAKILYIAMCCFALTDIIRISGLVLLDLMNYM